MDSPKASKSGRSGQLEDDGRVSEHWVHGISQSGHSDGENDAQHDRRSNFWGSRFSGKPAGLV